MEGCPGRTNTHLLLDRARLAVAKKRAGATREEKLKNLMTNHSMVFVGMFDEAFSDIAESMTAAMERGGAGTAGGRGGAAPKIKSQIALAFSEIREEMDLRWPQNDAVFKRYVSGPAFDEGIRIVESYDFGRPKLTEKLSDEVLASYIFLAKGGDKKLGSMLKELSEWQARVPNPPWAG